MSAQARGEDEHARLPDYGFTSKRRVRAKLSTLMKHLIPKVEMTAAYRYTLTATSNVVTVGRYSYVAPMREQDMRAPAGPFCPAIFGMYLSCGCASTLDKPNSRTNKSMMQYNIRVTCMMRGT